MTVVQTSGQSYTAVSGDTKPTTGVTAGARLYETNTQTWYIFNGTAWFELAPETIAANLPNMPSDAQKDALDGANAPEADNPFATMADVPTALPTGGTEGQLLAKASADNFDTEWADAPAGGDLDIPSLPAASALDGTELVPVVQGGTTKKTTAQDIADLGGGSIPDPLELGAAVFADYVAVGGAPAATGGVRLGDAFVEGDKGYVMGVAGGSDYRLIGVNSDDGWVEVDPDNFGIRIGSDQNGVTPSTFVQIYNGGISAVNVGSAFFGLDPNFGISLYGSAQLSIAGLPTTDPHVAGQFWNQGFADVAALDTYLQAGGKLVSVSVG